MEKSIDQQVQAYWKAFVQQRIVESAAVDTGYQVWPFGSSPKMADKLGALVVQGIKTATASLLWSYEAEEQPYPIVGGYNIILDGQGFLICILRTTQVYIAPFDEVDEEQAFLEGEGDRTLRYWREVHWDYFEEECRSLGKTPDSKMPIVCERFTLVFK